ncbi:helix-turn-helix domain-containing protein [Melittangium boletus]|uniref:helix-turn-helix domain-containing protein n=1 Tax=Melittangium boletus TaxID=83453 RepID=UPI001FE3FE62|nr:helix-turn-helix domain-containing protein [Melittangium boletus]
MRRRPPRLIRLLPEEASYLERLVRDGRTEQRIARRARVLLAMDDPATIVSELADRLELDRRSIWALCRRFDEFGVDVVMDAPRPGRPRELSPPPARRGGAAGVL